MTNYMPSKMRDEITHPFPNFLLPEISWNKIKFRTWINNHIDIKSWDSTQWWFTPNRQWRMKIYISQTEIGLVIYPFLDLN